MSGVMTIRRDVGQKHGPALRPIPGMGMIGERARANCISGGELENRVAWPFQPIEIAKCFNDSAKRIDQIHKNIFVQHIAGGRICYATLPVRVGGADADGIHVADVRRHREDPGAIGRHPMRGLRQPAIVIVGVHNHRQANLVEIGSAFRLSAFGLG